MNPIETAEEFVAHSGSVFDRAWKLATRLKRDIRLRNAFLTSASTMLLTGITIGVSLVLVPLTVGYLGRERYGVWLTISSLLSWLAISDLGFGGNAMISALAEANGRDDPNAARELISTGFWSMTVIAALLTLTFAVSYPYVSWRAVFNVSALDQSLVDELGPAVTLAFIGFALIFPLGIITACFHGYQEGYLSSLWGVAGQGVSLIAVVVVTRRQGGLCQLVLAYWGARVVVTIASALHFYMNRPWLLPTPRAVSGAAFRRLAGLGSKYLVTQLSGIGMFQSQPMIITQVLGPSQVGVFAITQRIVSLPSVLIGVMNNSLFPAYGEAQARGDWPWIRRTFRRAMISSAVLSVCLGLPPALCARMLVRILADETLVPDFQLVIYFTVYSFIVALITPAATLLAGLERMGPQAVLATTNALLTVSAGIVLTRASGLTGMALAMILGMVAVNAAGQLFELRRLFGEPRTKIATHVTLPDARPGVASLGSR